MTWPMCHKQTKEGVMVGWILVGIGALLSFACGIWLLILAFQKHWAWGVGSIFVPLVSFVFVIMNWSMAWKPFAMSCLGVLLCVGGMMMLPDKDKAAFMGSSGDTVTQEQPAAEKAPVQEGAGK